MTSLTILNVFIIKALKKNASAEVRRNVSEKAQIANKKRENRLSRISICIVIIFAICNMPRFIPNIAELFFDDTPEVSTHVNYRSSL